ncbi:hypothetical protein BGZ63DRAFT_360470 [Mariannaea sp. PMI_226]|nr:hypothetical protein BGZ63DRAFT_360470 [Mariannaea sp. PMI_226]
MARSRQTARKSLGGRAPRKIPPGPHAHHFPDHAGRSYTVVTRFPNQAISIPKLGIQLYCLGNPSPSPEALGEKLLWSDAIAGWGNARNYWPRVDVFTGFSTIEECVAHHRQEKTHRKAAIREMRQKAVAGLSEEDAQEKLVSEIRGKEPWPHIVPTWCPTEQFWREYDFRGRYRSWILVATSDRLTWDNITDKGLTLVRFDLDVTPAMESLVEDLGIDEESCLEGETYGWLLVEKSGFEKCPAIDISVLCARDPPQRNEFLKPDDPPERIHEILYGWHTPGCLCRLFDFWSDTTTSLWDCTYRQQSCDACDDGEPHEECENQLDEHYFDDDGQCIACRRFVEYRRRSKRLAAKDQNRS